MSDGMDRPTKRGLGSPPNDGAPRPNPPRGAKISRACNAARHQGELDGLRRAARLICFDCGHPMQDGCKLHPAIRQGGRWVHRFHHTDSVRYCGAGRIQDAIAAMPKHGDPPAQPAKAKSQAQEMVTVCASCLRACCWKGILYCEEYKQANIIQRTRADLEALALEDPSYWEGHS